MRKSRIIIATIVGLALAQVASAQYTQTIIGGDAGNGNFQTLDPFSAWNGTSPLSYTTNTTGRRLIGSGGLGTFVEFPGWRMDRDYYSGGNNSYGLDGASSGTSPMPGWPNVYPFMNSGDATFTSDRQFVALRSGDVITVSFDLTTGSLLPTELASCSGTIDLGDGQTFSWSAADASVTAADTMLNFSTNFTLTADAYSAQLTLLMSSGRDGASSASQTKIDNVSLVALSSTPFPYIEVVIGEHDGNGNFETLRPFAIYRGETLQTNASYYVTNDLHRAFALLGTTDANIRFPGWRVDRDYGGGNNAFGMDSADSAPMPGWPNSYWFANAGDHVFTSDAQTVNLGSGDVVNVSFDLTTATLLVDDVASCGGTIDFGGESFSWAQSDAEVVAANTMLNFSTNFTLTKKATTATLTLDLTTGRTGTSAASQTKIDNVAVIAYPVVDRGTVIIGGTIRNGDIQTVDPFYAWTNEGRTNSISVTTNTTGRRLISNSSIGAVVDWPGWSSKRTYYNGGNGAWGIDNGKYDVPTVPNTAYFMNSGDCTITSSNYPVNLAAGNTVSVSFGMQADRIATNESIRVYPSCSGMIDFGGGQTFEWTTNDFEVTAARTVASFDKEFVLNDNATNVTLTLYFSTGRGYDNAAGRSACQCFLDNISLIAYGTTLGGEPFMVDLMPVSNNVYRIELYTPNQDSTYPVSKADLANGGTWAQVPHSDNSGGPFANNDLTVSVASGTNRVIYVESTGDQAFFGIGED